MYEETAGGKDAKYCVSDSLNPELVQGKIVVCEQGIIDRVEKGENVKKAGGAVMLLINTKQRAEELTAYAYVLQVSSLGYLAGEAIKKYLNSTKKPTASITFKGTVYGKPAPVMAAFSSRGPSVVGPDLIKPDVTAPGMNILAAWPAQLG